MASNLAVFCILTLAVVLIGRSSALTGRTCSEQRVKRGSYFKYYQSSYRQKYHTKCGFAGWKRCTKYRYRYYRQGTTNYYYKYYRVYVCCQGWRVRYSGATDCAIHNQSPVRTYCPSNIQRAATGATTTVRWTKPTFREPFGYGLSIVSTYNRESLKLGVGTVRVTYTATSSNNNLKTSCSFTVRVYDKNECKGNHGCAHTCTNTVGSYYCTCKTGYHLGNDKRACPDTDECTKGDDTCEQKCSNTQGSYTCSCHGGYQLKADNRKCQDIDECMGNHPCAHNCTNKIGSYECSCTTGFVLTADNYTCGDANECDVRNGGCMQTCTNNHGSYSCSCLPGYTQDTTDLHKCIDNNECTHNNGTGNCSHICTNTPGSYDCSCRQGYALAADRRNCQDVKECDDPSHGCAHICVEKSPGFECTCKSGYTLMDDGRGCTDNNECLGTNHGCASLCINDVGGFHCACLAGYQLASDQKNCEDTDECASSQDGCSHTCTNTVGSFICSCPFAYILSADGRKCNPLADLTPCVPSPPGPCQCKPGYKLHTDNIHCIHPCFVNPCLHGGKCAITPATPSGYTCNCSAIPYTGSDCDLGYITLSHTELSSDVGEISQELSIYANVLTELSFTSGTPEVELIPNPVIITSPGNSTNFAVKINKRGRHLVKLNTAGRDGNNFVLEQDFAVTGTDVFSRNSLNARRFSLPKGCFYVALKVCNGLEVLFSSTSPWYALWSDHNVKFTYGVVFIESNKIALPVSETGWEIRQNPYTYVFSVGRVSSSRHVWDGEVIADSRNAGCATVEISRRDVIHFVNSQTLFKTFLMNVYQKIPSFPILEPNPKSSTHNQRFKVSLITGSKIQRIPSCRGAPTFGESLYTVFRFNHGIRLSMLGTNIDLPATTGNEEYCAILDLCNNYGNTLMVIFPTSSRQRLLQIDALKALSAQAHIDIIPRGFAVSLENRLNVHRTVKSVEFWNGDEMFSYPVTKTATAWLAVDLRIETDALKSFGYSLTGKNDVFLHLPSQSIPRMFVDETAILMKNDLNGGFLWFKVFGEYRKIEMMDIALASAYTYASVGGPPRVWCGKQANPPGIFLKFGLDFNAFRGIPIMEDFIAKVTSSTHAFITFDSLDNVTGVSPSAASRRLLGNLNTKVEKMLKFVDKEIAVVAKKVNSDLQNMLNNLKTTSLKLKDATKQDNAKSTASLSSVSDRSVALNEIFGEVKSVSVDLEDNVRMTFVNSLDNLITGVKNELKDIETDLKQLTDNIRTQVLGYLTKDISFGFRFKLDVTLPNVDMPGIEGEFVFSDKNMARCHDSPFVFQDLQGVPSFRFYGAFVKSTPIKYFFSVGKGYGLEFAFSMENFQWVAGFHTKFLFMNIELVKRVVYINPRGMFGRGEAKLFDQVAAVVETKMLWKDKNRIRNSGIHPLYVKATFFSGKGGMDGMVTKAIQDIAKYITDAALVRIDKAKILLRKEQKRIAGAQNWLEKKKRLFDKANVVFNTAIRTLRQAKRALDAAKGPFKSAMNKLRRAQKNVDRLCRIRKCKKVCIPGIKFKRCGFFKIPCPRFSKCMLKIPNPACIVRNVVCRIVREAAYFALEAAKIYVRVPILALDRAKVAVSGAEYQIDQSRIVIDAAKMVLTLAQEALERVKAAIEVAKFALDGLKLLFKGTLLAVNYAAKHRGASICNVRNCVLDAELYTRSGYEYDVHCEINIYGLGWETVNFEINFKKMQTSIRNIAKTIVSTAFKSLIRVGRKRRSIAVADQLPSNEVLFQQLCRQYNSIDTFLRDSIQLLLNAANETITTLEEADNTTVLDIGTDSLDPDERGINVTDAQEEYNISRDSIIQMLKQTDKKAEIKQLREILNWVDSQNKETADVIRQFDILMPWKNDMENITKNTFSEYPNNCVSFQDCVRFAIDQLEINYGLVDSRVVDPIRPHLTALKVAYAGLLNSSSLNATAVLERSKVLISLLDDIQGDAIFCASPPAILVPFVESVIYTGSDHVLECMTNKSQHLMFSWYKDDQKLHNQTNLTYTITNATEDDDGDYRCEVSNHVGITNTSAHIFVYEMPAVTSLIPRNRTLLPGESIDILCTATGLPTPIVAWTTTSTENVPPGPRLKIPSVLPSHGGVYQCKAWNSAGIAYSSNLTLTVRTATVACPESEISIGFVTTKPEATHSTPLVNNPYPTVSLTDKFNLALRHILTDSDTNITTYDVGVCSSTVTLIVAPPCPVSRAENGSRALNSLYQSRVDDILSVVDYLTDYHQPSTYLFEHRDRLYSINPAELEYSSPESRCVEGGLLKAIPHACVEPGGRSSKSTTPPVSSWTYESTTTPSENATTQVTDADIYTENDISTEPDVTTEPYIMTSSNNDVTTTPGNTISAPTTTMPTIITPFITRPDIITCKPTTIPNTTTTAISDITISTPTTTTTLTTITTASISITIHTTTTNTTSKTTNTIPAHITSPNPHTTTTTTIKTITMTTPTATTTITTNTTVVAVTIPNATTDNNTTTTTPIPPSTTKTPTTPTINSTPNNTNATISNETTHIMPTPNASRRYATTNPSTYDSNTTHAITKHTTTATTPDIVTTPVNPPNATPTRPTTPITRPTQPTTHIIATTPRIKPTKIPTSDTKIKPTATGTTHQNTIYLPTV